MVSWVCNCQLIMESKVKRIEMDCQKRLVPWVLGNYLYIVRTETQYNTPHSNVKQYNTINTIQYNTKPDIDKLRFTSACHTKIIWYNKPNIYKQVHCPYTYWNSYLWTSSCYQLIIQSLIREIDCIGDTYKQVSISLITCLAIIVR